MLGSALCFFKAIHVCLNDCQDEESIVVIEMIQVRKSSVIAFEISALSHQP
jgi:hypothetical protein